MESKHKIQGPALLLAGPGTGKTYTLGLRLKYLIVEMDVPPDSITVITFTAEAAKNMRSRISDPEKEALFLPYTRQPSNILTMHSLGFKIIRSYPDKVNLQESIRLIPGDLEKSILLGDAAQLSGHGRSLGQEVATCRQFGDCQPVDEPKCQVCEIYKHILRKCSSLDYDEQILLAVELLEKHPKIRNEYQQFTRHLLVDEYQDINSAQFKLIQLLSEGQEDGLFVVGDDDQSIYSWRGGSPKFIREFASKVIPLNKSYRCHSNILEGSLKVVETFDSDRLQKNPFEYMVEDGPKIKVHNAPSDKKEAIIVRSIVQSALPSQDVLILVPQRQFAESVAEELRSNQIGFTTRANVPGIGLPLISRLNDWLTNPSDSVAFRRCLESFMERIDSPVPTKRARKAERIQEREGAFSQIASLWKKVLSGEVDSLWSSLEQVHEDHDLYTPLWEAFSLLLQQYRENGDIREFSTSLATTLSPWRGIKPFLGEVTAWVDSIRYSGMEGADASVRIMTFQGAKGLEAKVVCVLGLEEGIIPRGESDIPEQSRLLFVSMSRSINELHLFHARVRSSQVLMRNAFAGGKPSVEPSRFIEAIPDEYSEKVYHRA
ncbi:MAG: ATP-dependent helicase [Proteobacteria bacterium]|nr:ATP-dependent helicase [Pseudomonadota bacterium]MBU4258986.1 ATP-dependent helicase [Pseudomonadota bacterium]MBU4289089.1 ATP-dependent helicase [Pseudomonadota bacterium]MBU4415161.1 ATP-dependent helicase [Pseudomonadota bacterium]MCG2757268.1 ATP-dependent helicase [Desulfobacteraceae bacterium]